VGDFREIGIRGDFSEKKIEGIQPHQGIGVDFTRRATGDEATGRLVLRKILSEIHRMAGENFPRLRIEQNRAEGLGGEIEAEIHGRSFPAITGRSSINKKRAAASGNRSLGIQFVNFRLEFHGKKGTADKLVVIVETTFVAEAP